MAKTTAEQIVAVELSIAKLQAKLSDLIAKRDAADALGNLQAGTRVRIRLGRADSLRQVDATVLATAETEAGQRIKVQFGTGFDADVAVIQPTQIICLLEGAAE